MVKENLNRPRVNPSIVLREEFEDRAILFDPDTGDTFGLNPVSLLVWKCLDGCHSLEDILKKLHASFKNVSPKVQGQVKSFIQELIRKGLAQ
jgi:SynChlorMet cassette protein ScmD